MNPGWFPLPRLPQVAGLAAAGDDAVVLEALSPDGTVRFLVRSHGNSAPEYSLELIVCGVPEGVPLMTAVRYTSAQGPERVLLVPVVRGPFGLAASYVRLPDFSGEEWTASMPASVGRDSVWERTAIELSVGASLNDATRDAWRCVRERISDEGMRSAIGEALG
ncbi:hypothetical protein [Streptomyces sp. NPDC003247]|uniref:hypothetical protein n=1 Tax=Streptomyces sp. NPDC003247 TaxID=3364677 RepID=UPI0036C914ED